MLRVKLAIFHVLTFHFRGSLVPKQYCFKLKVIKVVSNKGSDSR